jgi:hypothetical protein
MDESKKEKRRCHTTEDIDLTAFVPTPRIPSAVTSHALMNSVKVQDGKNPKRTGYCFWWVTPILQQ